MANERLKVLVVDDSEICRIALRAVLETDPAIKVVGEARDGVEALDKVRALQPDLVTMDLAMPRRGGLDAIEHIMEERPTPILVVTERPRMDGVDMTFASLARGAVDLVPKALNWRVGSAETLALLDRVKTIARTRLPARTAGPPQGQPAWRARPVELVAIGASTGGPAALATILTALPSTFRLPIAIVQHMDEQFHEGLVQWLQRQARIKVREAVDGERLLPGCALLGPPGLDFTLDRYGVVRLSRRIGGSAHVPSVDSLFFSVARAGLSAAGVLLTGMGSDGADGLKAMRAAGCLTVAQDQATSVVYGMPGVAVARGAAEQVLPPSSIAELIKECSMTTPQQPSTQAPVPATRRKTIVVLDDSTVVLDACRDALTDAGYEAVCVDNPLILPSVLRRNPADLALIDVRMPAVAGDGVTKILSQSGLPSSRVVLFSDMPESDLEVLAQACGALGYIKKGDEQHLLGEVEKFLKLAT
ncbi:MAG: chemotaxis-specific protein-glutamate methyltransferase CheB [Archangiaceae bacterium]|nr:chemotaxis-specific protein-glutamate methyltransferase CheB [Archangiaceae bacterium]